MKAGIQNRLERLEARRASRLHELSEEEINAMIARLVVSNADDSELPGLIASCMGWDERQASTFIAELVALNEHPS
jgi:hypothetical protein